MNKVIKTKVDATYTLVVLAPLKEIISNLENGQYRDSDVNFLNSKLESFTKLALEMYKVQIHTPKTGFEILNEYTTKKYLFWFNGLLDFFKKH